MNKLATLTVVATILSGCVPVTEGDIKDAGPMPKNYRQIVAKNLRETLFDPYSVRDAQISEPRVHRAVVGPLWNVCFRGNAKNRYGAYTGLKYTIYVIRDGRITSSADGAEYNCRDAKFSKFNELYE